MATQLDILNAQKTALTAQIASAQANSVLNVTRLQKQITDIDAKIAELTVE